MVREVSISR